MNKLTLGVVAAFFSTSVNASWSIVDIGGLGGGYSEAAAINDLGQITGSSKLSNSSFLHAYITDANGTNIRDISAISGSDSDISFLPLDINSSGQVIGDYSNQISADIKSFITGPNGQGMTVFSTDDGAATTSIRLSGINDSGMVTGGYFNEDGSGKSFVADSNGSGIRYLAEGLSAINNSGQGAGTFLSSDGRIPIPRTHAFIADNDGSGIRDLSDPGEKYYKGSMAYDINNSGQVAGILSTENHRWTQAFITGEDGDGIIKLGTIPGLWGGYAVAINDAGQAVGISTDITGSGAGSFIYANGGLTDLSNLPEVIDAGWTSLFVSDINNNGQIVGTGYLANDPNPHSFLLSFTSDTVFTPYDFYIPPIPEPSTYLMLLAGLGLLGFVSGRNQINAESINNDPRKRSFFI